MTDDLLEALADLAAQLAAVEKERDEAADSYEITLARMAENCTERQGERDALAARVAQLEGALLPTAENVKATADEYCRRAGYKVGIVFITEQVLVAIRQRAGLGGEEGTHCPSWRSAPILAEACEVIRELLEATPATQEEAAAVAGAIDFLKRAEGGK